MQRSSENFHSSRNALLCAVSFLGFVPTTTLQAQVAPTEVNEQAVDEFGMERKTGRFVWSSGEIVGIGPEGARIGVSVTGVRTAPYRQKVLQAWNSSVAQLSQPSITVNPVPVDFPVIAGEVHGHLRAVTIDYFGGSYTFECNVIVCASQFLLPNVGMRPYDNGDADEFNAYEFRDKFGTLIRIETGLAAATTTVIHPDGRQETITYSGDWYNNFGFMVRRSSAGSQGTRYTAVNQAIDYCSVAFGAECPSLTEDRFATVSSTPVSPLLITDIEGGVTKVDWVEKTAMEARPPIGYPDPSIPTIPQHTARYPTGLTLPGETQQSISISYDTHSPTLDIHDDIRVSQIIRNGVTIDYDADPYYPFGKAIRDAIAPTQGYETLHGIWGNAGGGRLEQESIYGWLSDRDAYCDSHGYSATDPNSGSGNPSETPSSQPSFPESTCRGGFGFSGGSGGGLNLQRTYDQPPPDDDQPDYGTSAGSQIYELTITASIASEIISKSFALRPYSREGAARRRLVWTEDGLGRRTSYLSNRYDELGGIRLPEGNWTINVYDIRGNIIETRSYPKGPGDTPSGTPLTTTYTYTADCTETNIAWCNRPITMTDPLGNVTEIEYNQYGQVTKQVSPAPAVGEPRPTLVNEYEPRTAYIKDPSGNPTEAGPEISMLTTSYTCISSVVCDANTPATDKVVTVYDYGPETGLNNLLLRGIAVTAINEAGNLETRRTCYTYNYFGERISETLPEAGLTSCPA